MRLRDEYGLTPLSLSIGIATVVVVVVVAILIWGGGEDDPCEHIISTGKVTVVTHDDGWQRYGGRDVWCGPGPNPARQ